MRLIGREERGGDKRATLEWRRPAWKLAQVRTCVDSRTEERGKVGGFRWAVPGGRDGRLRYVRGRGSRFGHGLDTIYIGRAL
jgi:hypothetical protein